MKKSMIIIAALLVTVLCACGETVNNETVNNETVNSETEQSSTEADYREAVTEENKKAEGTQPKAEKVSYSMLLYTEAPNQNSSIKIEYPSFAGSKADRLNALINDKIQKLAQIDTSFFPSDTGLTIDYQSAVTLLNEKIASIIFWGPVSMEGGAYPMDNLITLNIDLESMEEITFEDLYTVNTDFINTFFDKAFFPTNPVTSYDEAGFGEMLKLQSPEYQSVDPFSIPGNVSCFLKADGIVLSMPAVHATGNDHFEAQLKYDDIQQFYLPQDKYWE